MTKLTPFPRTDIEGPAESGDGGEPPRRRDPVPSLDDIVEGVMLQLIHGRRSGRRRGAGIR